MFEINNKEYTSYEICGSTVYEIKDFYKYPDEVIKLINNISPKWHKEKEMEQGISLNGQKFYDLRHENVIHGIKKVTNFLSNICKQDIHFKKNIFATNIFKFIDPSFNKCEDNYWWPHNDSGYTALVYLNKQTFPGTNLYTRLCENESGTEHSTPWQSKSNYILEHNLEAEYNKLVFFDGKNLCHSMSVTDNLFCDIIRYNQVFFFSESKKLEKISSVFFGQKG
jgi:hypothetical protein